MTSKSFSNHCVYVQLDVGLSRRQLAGGCRRLLRWSNSSLLAKS